MKDRALVLRGKLSWNKRLPEDQQRTMEEIEAEVDRIIADDRAHGAERARLHAERSREWWARYRARVRQNNADELGKLGELLRSDAAFGLVLEQVRQVTAWVSYYEESYGSRDPRFQLDPVEIEAGGLFAEATLIEGHQGRFVENDYFYPSYRDELRTIERLKSAGVLQGDEQIEAAVAMAERKLVGRLRTLSAQAIFHHWHYDELPDLNPWADAFEARDWTLILRDYPAIRAACGLDYIRGTF